MPTVPLGQNLGAYGQGQLAQAPGMGNMLMAAAIQAQDPSRSMPEGQDRPRFPAHKSSRRLLGLIKSK